MDSYMLPSLPPWVDTSMLDINSLVATNVEEGVVHPHCSQGSAAPLSFPNTASFPMTPRAGQRIPTKDDWESHRTEITRLYRDEKQTLKEVMKFMLERYDFRATTKMYKTRISDWDIRRNLRWSEREDACRIVKQRWLSGEKVSKIIVRGQEKNLAIFLRHMRNAERGDNSRKLLSQVENSGMHTRIANLGAFYSSLQDEAPMAPLYPAGDERHVEVICLQTAHIYHSSSNDLIRNGDDLYGNMWNAVQRANKNRYKEARVLLNRAGQWLQEHIRYEADAVLLYLLRSFALRSLGRIHQFDPLCLFHRFALALSDVVHGPRHPLTIVLSQLLAVQDWVSAASSAVQAALGAVQFNGALNESGSVTHWSRDTFAWVLVLSGDYTGAGQVRLKTLEGYQNQKLRYPFYQICATSSLALHYLEFEPRKQKEAARLLESIQHFQFDSGTKIRDYAAYCSLLGLARLAEKSGDLGKAEHYFRGCAEAAVRCWGEGDLGSVVALENLARVLDLQGQHDEAAQVWKRCQFSDNEGVIGLAVSDEEVRLGQPDDFQDGNGNGEIPKL